MSFPVSKSNRKRLRKTDAGNVKGFRPQLTSLVDVMTILLIYLLKSFSSEGEIITVSQDLQLPESSARKSPELTVTLMVNNEFLMAEDEHIASVQAILATDDLTIAPLEDWLQRRREMTEKIEKYSNDTKFTGDITIQGDRRIKFRLLKKIMYTCGRQGYNNFSLAVRKREG